MDRVDLDTLGLAYSGLVAVGGVIGWIKAGSAASLVAGLGSGAAMAYGVQNDKRVALGTSAVLLVVMTRRFFRTGKFMPAGLVSLFSAFFAYNYYQLLFA
ncbi:transmembrane protein 14C-like protein [Cystobasidium minutum MCA 4210]|uniref:transmembrane protein 14C-like protein n=1 Tax=Cystobasidium minutum MCA 4210 TaxID=1397322 RepID=UPI0034CFD6EA|eukprot:jgi/Rhomi1/192891/gm1.1105_g